MSEILKNKIIAIHNHITEEYGLEFRTQTFLPKGYITAQQRYVIQAVYDGCLAVPKKLSNLFLGQNEENYLKSKEYQVFLAYIQKKPLPVQETSNSSINIGSMVNGVIVNAIPGGALVYSIGSLLQGSNQNNVNQAVVDLFKLLDKCINLFYDFLEAYKTQNPAFDVKPYLPDIATIAQQPITNNANPASTVNPVNQNTAFNNLLQPEILNYKANLITQEEERKAKLPQPYTTKQIAVGFAGLLGLTAVIAAIKKANE
ncbi:hypothetical protein VB776_16285 [Arcicella sp. DC2W]|uniref:Uncharacterized protein n=1 Tax=Arcicella gelida TaxID=2984195 RepID=A0ABU5S7Q9_9BACT|nr:hypothetical protein [Arcicella sp. DC2W]MEA5404492.1 hypothetical protein [Arcicella sp. DC2W]